MNLDDLDDDIRDHLERETRDNIERGMNPEEAFFAALRKFGNITKVKEDTRAVWRRAWIEQSIHDARDAIRTLRRGPIFAAVLIVTLATALGLNTAVFSVVNSVLLRPLTYPDADHLAWINAYDPNVKRDFTALRDAMQWRKQAQSFSALAGFSPQQAAIQTPAGAVQMNGLEVAGDFWKMLSPQPVQGRMFGADEQDMIVLSWSFFQHEFAGNPQVIGAPLLMDGRVVTVVGVLPEDFRFQLPAWWGSSRIDGYFPVPRVDFERYRSGNVFAKLKPGVLLSQALSEVKVIQKQLVAPAQFRPFADNLYAEPLQQKLVGGSRRALMVLFTAGIFVLLIAAGNVANLLLARASARRREIAIRAAMGAGRMQIVRHLMIENLMVALLGAGGGLLIARWAISALIKISPDAVPRLSEASIDGRALIYTFLLASATAVLFGLGPAVSMWQNDLQTRLKDGPGASGGFAGRSIRRTLVASELALSIVLLAGAGLLLKSSWRMNQHPGGFTPERILTLTVHVPPRAQQPFLRELERRLQTLPGVDSAGISTWLLFGGATFPRDAGTNQTHIVRINAMSPGYFKALGMRMVNGRSLAESDSCSKSCVVLMNESMAREAFGDADPLGQIVSIPARATVVGVVADLKYSKLDATAPPEIYVPIPESGLPSATVAIATSNPSAITAAVRTTIADLDPGLAAYDVKTLDQGLAESIAPRRFNLFLLGTFAGVALILAVVGVYGVIAYSVAERTREIGVRMALGAETSGVVGMVVREGMSMALGGIATGIVAAFGLTRLMTNLLYEVKPDDPMTFLLTGALLVVTALAACCGPAWKAASIDPVVALRYE